MYRITTFTSDGKIRSATLQKFNGTSWVDVEPLEVREDGKVVMDAEMGRTLAKAVDMIVGLCLSEKASDT